MLLTRPTSLLVLGSIRETVKSGLMTHTASGVTAMCCVWMNQPLNGVGVADGCRAGRGVVATTTTRSGLIGETLSG